ncbi:MAG: hypothetical protein IT305_02880 [Chloroflexi bacterium]|nr:hypothetical protein [Chloroflexota bacterium]
MRPLALAMLLFAIALMPRLLDLGQHVTADEDLTLGRSADFARAVADGDWRDTYQVGHPEVTVMWVTTLAVGVDTLQPFEDSLRGAEGRVAASRPGYLAALIQARRGMAVVHAAAIAGAGLLVWRLWGPLAGVVGGLMLALEPFLVAHGRILRSDALLSEFGLLAILSALAYWRPPMFWSGTWADRWRTIPGRTRSGQTRSEPAAGGRRQRGRGGVWLLAVCAVTTGLALLTKTPSLILLGVVPLVALGFRRDWRGMLLWGAGAALTYALLWPAIWVRPGQTVQRVLDYTAGRGGTPMDAGGFLLGTAVADPGPLFYALALLLRLSPVVVVGLAFWLLGRSTRRRLDLALLVLVAFGFVGVMAVMPKKADRYVLPAVPLLVTVAAVGIAGAATTLVRRVATADETDRATVRRGVSAGHPSQDAAWPWARCLRHRVHLGASLAVVSVSLGLTASLLSVWPYPLAYYDPLLGGGKTAEASMLVGWGEGLDQVASRINAEPNAAQLTVATLYPEVMAAQLTGQAVPLDAFELADIAVVYVAADQRDLLPSGLADRVEREQPWFTIDVNGIRYARVYRLPTPVFGGVLAIHGIDVRPRTTSGDRTITVELDWRSLGDVPAGLEVRAALITPDGRVSTERRAPLPPADQPHQQIALKGPTRDGRYLVRLSVADAASGTTLPVSAWPGGAPWAPDQMVFRTVFIRVQ